MKLQNQNLYSVLKNEVYWKLFLVAFVLLLTGLQKSYTAANIDSLQSILSNTNDTTILVETLIQISDEYVLYDVDNAIKYAKESYELASKFDDNELVIRSGFTTIKSLMPKGAFDEALDLTKELVSLSREINNKRFESDAHAFAAAIYRRKGNSEMTLKSYDRCRILSDEIGYDLGLAKAQTGYGEYKEREGLYLESFENYNRALEITRSEKSRNRDLEILVLKKIAFTHRYLGDYDKALEQFIEVLTYYESLGDIVRVADLHNNIASVYWDIESDEKAIEYWNLAIDLAKKTNNKDALANAYQGINIYYRFNGKFDIAEEYCLLDLKLRNEMGDIRGLSYSFKNIGRNYQAKGDLVSAKSYLLKGLENAQQLGQQLKIAWMNQQVGRLLNDMNKPLEAIEYILKSAELSKSINDIK
ncbi:MAG: tetratricopeptide repeat protein, partial [Saprospiraceae bacterium]|nr:tetratricopeptide repeat protein [Saprospiraceae bacterium]